MANGFYKSIHTGMRIDEGISKILSGDVARDAALSESYAHGGTNALRNPLMLLSVPSVAWDGAKKASCSATENVPEAGKTYRVTVDGIAHDAQASVGAGVHPHYVLIAGAVTLDYASDPALTSGQWTISTTDTTVKSLVVQVGTGLAEAVDNAMYYKEQAAAARAGAERALDGVANKLNSVPSGSTNIINDLTTGGAGAALAAEQGKVIDAKLAQKTPIEHVAGIVTGGGIHGLRFYHNRLQTHDGKAWIDAAPQRADSLPEISFTENQWVISGTEKLLTIPPSQHGRQSSKFTYTLRHSVSGAMRGNTFATMCTDVRYNANTGAIELHCEDAYSGEIVFTG